MSQHPTRVGEISRVGWCDKCSDLGPRGAAVRGGGAGRAQRGGKLECCLNRRSLASGVPSTHSHCDRASLDWLCCSEAPNRVAPRALRQPAPSAPLPCTYTATLMEKPLRHRPRHSISVAGLVTLLLIGAGALGRFAGHESDGEGLGEAHEAIGCAHCCRPTAAAHRLRRRHPQASTAASHGGWPERILKTHWQCIPRAGWLPGRPHRRGNSPASACCGSPACR